MYALIVPASAPFVLLATVMGLSWWEDHVLPPAEPAAALVEHPIPLAAPAVHPKPPSAQGALTREVVGR
ncbi:hypothetical protein ABT039_25735 [Streptomyces lasiicapitis]|uniref:hypothetical protein n=1 Tax=Streptomyces TaxID=1883 RepID=UPI0013DCCFAC|nr:hypothetical protein [Streptomyces aureoverticillatus]QIB47799.1 hypothetical protein G3H79_36725 [Streptomyces aureoverticillatus]